MTSLGLLLLLLAAATPVLERPLRRLVDDPVTLVAYAATALLATAAWVAELADRGHGDGLGDLVGGADAAAAPLGVLAAVTAGSHVVRGLFRLTRGEVLPHRRSRRRPTPPRLETSHDLVLDAPGSVLRGGAWIGYLERAAVAATILSGFPEGLALVLAVKGVGRYPELREAGRDGGHRADAPEEFIIGTIASVLWASACAGTAALLGA